MKDLTENHNSIGKYEVKVELNHCYNMDCIEGMRLMEQQGIKADWVITDPPYGISIGVLSYTNGKKASRALANRRNYSGTCDWDNRRIEKEAFDLMFKVSDNQIFFGGNYYTDILLPTKSWIVWNKRRYDEKDRCDFGDCELAWCSKGVARCFNYLYNGMLQGDMKNKDPRFHATQKPTQLWTKILQYYTKEGDTVLDPFAGSQSLHVACHRLKRNYIGFEIDENYYKQGCDWVAREKAQISIWDIV